LFNFLGRPVYSYPAMLYLGTVLGIYAQLFAAASFGLDTASTLTVTLFLFVFSLIGARLLHVLANWSIYRGNPRRVSRFSSGGASMYGGLLLAVPLSIPLLAALGIPFATFWDTATFTILLGMIITRVGCFLNGCCAGRPTAGWWGVNLPDYSGAWRRRIPAQILEIAWGSAVLAGAVLGWRRLPFAGALFLYTIGAYGAGRILMESLREEQERIMGVSVHTAISAAFVAVSVCGFAVFLPS
jgi:phosphatidylglycerol:prolipoprotein diacylglycerol transferase